jgi:hypothetical protein
MTYRRAGPLQRPRQRVHAVRTKILTVKSDLLAAPEPTNDFEPFDQSAAALPFIDAE